MPVKFTVDDINAVEENLRGLYVERDGKWQLDAEGAPSDDETKRQLSRTNAESAQRRKELEKWSKFGKSPEEIEQILERERQTEEDRAKKAGEWENLKKQLQDNHTREVNTLREENKKIRESLENYVIESEAGMAISSAKGVPQLLMPHVRKAAKVLEENGKFLVKVIDDTGNERLNNKGDSMSLSDLVGEMRQSEVYGRAFDGSGKSGSETPPNRQSGRPGNNNEDLMKLPPMERVRIVRERQASAKPTG